MTMIAPPSCFAGSTFAPTTTIAESPARSADRVYPQLPGSIAIAGSHFDPNTFTSKASPSPTFIKAIRAVEVGPSPAPLAVPSPDCTSRASRRSTARGRSNQRSPRVTTNETTTAVGTTASQSICGMYSGRERATAVRRADVEKLLTPEKSA